MTKRLLPLIALFLFALPLAATGQEEEKEWPPREGGFGMAALFGTEAIGGGPGYIWWDLGKKGRRLYFYTVFADTDYRTYFMNYTEPGLLMPGEKIDLTAYYLRRTGTHFFGTGPDREMEDGAFYGQENYLFELAYTLPLNKYFGLSGAIGYDRVVPRRSTLEIDDREDFHDDWTELDRYIEDVYPGIVDSREWEDEMNHYWEVGAWFDNTDGPRNFPVKGMYINGTVRRVDAHMGAEWNYWRYRAEAALFFPIVDEYNIIGMHARWDRLNGLDLPFYKLPALGQARFSTGYVMDRNAMRGVWEDLWMDANRGLATIEYRHRVKAGWYPDSWREWELPFDFDIEEFIRNMAWFGWVDAGQVWPDEDPPDTVRWAYGIGNVLYFNSGLNQQVTIGWSDDLSMYMLFAYGLQF